VGGGGGGGVGQFQLKPKNVFFLVLRSAPTSLYGHCSYVCMYVGYIVDLQWELY